MCEYLKRYAIEYRDPYPGAETLVWRTKAYSEEHARDNFIESCSYDGWEDAEIVSIKELTAA